MRRSKIIALLCLAGATTVGCASPRAGSPLANFERAQVYQPVRWPAGAWHAGDLPVEDAWFTAEDGTRLHGWYLHHENPTAVVLFAHGNAGNVTHCTDILRQLHDRHEVSVLTFDYRGYGRSEGTPDERGILEDARAARAWLAQHENISQSEIVLFGQSLGGGVMVDLAARDEARGLVLASTFTSLPDVAAHHLPLVPARAIMQNRLDSISKIADYHGPLLQVHGDHDRVVPYEQGRRLFAAANPPKRFVTNTGLDHNDPLPEEYDLALHEFLASLPPVSSESELVRH